MQHKICAWIWRKRPAAMLAAVLWHALERPSNRLHRPAGMCPAVRGPEARARCCIGPQTAASWEMGGAFEEGHLVRGQPNPPLRRAHWAGRPGKSTCRATRLSAPRSGMPTAGGTARKYYIFVMLHQRQQRQLARENPASATSAAHGCCPGGCQRNSCSCRHPSTGLRCVTSFQTS
jgi:hypothetical protein